MIATRINKTPQSTKLRNSDLQSPIKIVRVAYRLAIKNLLLEASLLFIITQSFRLRIIIKKLLETFIFSSNRLPHF